MYVLPAQSMNAQSTVVETYIMHVYSGGLCFAPYAGSGPSLKHDVVRCGTVELLIWPHGEVRHGSRESCSE